MFQINRNQKFKSDLLELKQTCHCQEFYLKKYFNGIRSQVGKELSHKLMIETKEEKKNEFTQLWNQIVDRVAELEEEFLQFKLSKDFSENTIKQLNSIEAMLKTGDPVLIEKRIRIEEENIQRNIFRDRTIVFLNGKDYLNKSYRELIDCKMLIINDEFISQKSFIER